MTVRVRLLAAAVLAVMAVLSAVLISNYSHSPRGAYRLASAASRGDIFLLAQTQGVLHGAANSDGTACFWLGNDLGGSALFWPYGYTAGGNPLAVYADSGNQVAASGQYVVMAGGRLADDVHSILGCPRFTQFWGVSYVVEAHPA
jgi:hypothetical protein